MKRSLEIVLASVITVILFGIIHNQITIRISPEFFTMRLPPHPWANGDNLTFLAFAWGITATWWIGLIGGLILAFFARFADEPHIIVSDLARPALIAIITAILLELLLWYFSAGFCEYLYIGQLNNVPQSAKANLFLVCDLHNMSYFAAGIAFVALSIWIIIARFRMRRYEKKKNV